MKKSAALALIAIAFAAAPVMASSNTASTGTKTAEKTAEKSVGVLGYIFPCLRSSCSSK